MSKELPILNSYQNISSDDEIDRFEELYAGLSVIQKKRLINYIVCNKLDLSEQGYISRSRPDVGTLITYGVACGPIGASRSDEETCSECGQRIDK